MKRVEKALFRCSRSHKGGSRGSGSFLFFSYILGQQLQQVLMWPERYTGQHEERSVPSRETKGKKGGVFGTCPKEWSSGSTKRRAMASSLQKMVAKMCSCTTRG